MSMTTLDWILWGYWAGVICIGLVTIYVFRSAGRDKRNLKKIGRRYFDDYKSNL